PFCACRTKQKPRCPSCSLHSRGQRSHWMRPSSRWCHHCPRTTPGWTISRLHALLLSHSAKLSTIPKVPRVDSKFSKRVGKAESVHQSEGRRGRSHQTAPLRRDTSDQIFDINIRDR